MSKTQQELAKKIISQLSTTTELDDGTFIIEVEALGHRGHYFNTKEVETIINSDGDTEKRTVADRATKAEATAMAVKDIAARLADGTIVIGDSWADDNLGKDA